MASHQPQPRSEEQVMSEKAESSPLTISRIAVVFFSKAESKWWVHKTYVDTVNGLDRARAEAKRNDEDGLGFDGVVRIVRLSAIEEIAK